MLDEEEHVLIVEETDEVERPKAGSTAQSEVTNHHGAGEERGGEGRAGQGRGQEVKESKRK